MHSAMFTNNQMPIAPNQYTNLMDTNKVQDMRRLIKNKNVYHGTRNDALYSNAEIAKNGNSIIDLKNQMKQMRFK